MPFILVKKKNLCNNAYTANNLMFYKSFFNSNTAICIYPSLLLIFFPLKSNWHQWHVNNFQGLGCLLYVELRRRLHNVGIRTIFCWGDKESEGFWFKQVIRDRNLAGYWSNKIRTLIGTGACRFYDDYYIFIFSAFTLQI